MLTDENDLPILDQLSEKGFVDCVFRIEELVRDGAFFVFRMRSSYQGRILSLKASLKSIIEPGFDGDMNLIREHVYPRGLEILSVGEESDTFLTVLSHLYGFDSGIRRMVQSESYTVIALQQRETNLETDHVRCKIFGRDSHPLVEDDYYESFFHVNLPDRLVYWNEKDPDYREPLLRALTAN